MQCLGPDRALPSTRAIKRTCGRSGAPPSPASAEPAPQLGTLRRVRPLRGLPCGAGVARPADVRPAARARRRRPDCQRKLTWHHRAGQGPQRSPYLARGGLGPPPCQAGRHRSRSHRNGPCPVSRRGPGMLRGSRGARTNPDADHLLARPARRSRRAGIGEDLAQLRALRLLHRDLSDLRPARRRARQPARPHLPDQGHAGERQAGVAAGGHPHRPLPVLPVLHDDLPLGRALHAPGRPRPALHRGDVHAALARPSAAPHAGRWCCRSRGCSGWR